MKVETKIRKLVDLREEIKKEAECWEGGGKCPLSKYSDIISHDDLAQLFDGLGCWRWTCIFCGEEFKE